MAVRARVDRYNGKMAVLMVDKKPVVVKRSSLPKGAKVGDWLEVEFEGVRVVSAEIDMEARGGRRWMTDDERPTTNGGITRTPEFDWQFDSSGKCYSRKR